MSKSHRFSRFEDLNVPPNKSFGITFAVIFLVVGLFPLLRGGAVMLWALIVSGCFLLIALTVPKVLALPNKLWTLFGHMMGKITNPLLLGILYFLFITPFSLLLRLFGKDFLRMGFSKKCESYWIEKPAPRPVSESMKSQF